MNARAQNDVLLQAADTTADSLYFPTLPNAAQRWRAPAGTPITLTIQRKSMATTGVILVDLTELAEATGEKPPAQPVTLEQAHVMLGRILAGQRMGAQRRSSAVSASPSPSKGAMLSALTPRQRDILREAASGKSNVEIARTLHIGVETVKSHVRQILMRLHARNRTELAALYQQCAD